MKRLLFKNFFYYLLVLALLSGCSDFEKISKIKEDVDNNSGKTSRLTFSINSNSLYSYMDSVKTKSVLLSLDTNLFLLKVYSSDGFKIFDGKYVDRPSSFYITKGTYDIELLSCKFNEPTFDKPLIGDQKCIIVNDSESVHVDFNCRQLNCGLKLRFDDNFRKQVIAPGVNIVQNNKRAYYGYNENRYIYVSTDPFEVRCLHRKKDSILFTKSLEAGEMLDLQLGYSNTKGNGVSFNFTYDTSRIWINSNLNLFYTLPTGCITINEAKQRIGEKNVMVFGYIYGGDPTANSIRVAPPFSSRTTIIIAPSMKERNINNFMAVELPAGEVRDGLNLVVHKKLIGKPVVVYGNIVENYYGMTGMKSTKKYILL